jgi:FMN-dependent NADH-azoreductase
VLGYIGIDDVRVIAAEGEESDKSVFLRACDEAERQLRDLAGHF